MALEILYGCLKKGLFLDIIAQDTYLVTRSSFLPSCNDMVRIRMGYSKEFRISNFHYITLKVIVHLITFKCSLSIYYPIGYIIDFLLVYFRIRTEDRPFIFRARNLLRLPSNNFD